MSEAKAAVLGRLRAALPRDADAQARAEAAVAARLDAPAPNLVPERGRLDGEGRIELFAAMARNVQAEVARLPSIEDVPAAVAGFLRRHNLPQRLVMAPDPALRAARFASQPLLRVREGTAVDEDATGLARALAGVAETGTLVLASGPEAPTLLAFLPENSVVVLAADAVDGAYEDAWARVRALPGGPPRSVNLVTGPSRTGDIAQKIELGVHGPRRLLILIVDRMPRDGGAPEAGDGG